MSTIEALKIYERIQRVPNIYFGFIVELSDVVFCERDLVLRAVYSANIAGFTTMPTHLVRIVKAGFLDV